MDTVLVVGLLLWVSVMLSVIDALVACALHVVWLVHSNMFCRPPACVVDDVSGLAGLMLKDYDRNHGDDLALTCPSEHARRAQAVVCGYLNTDIFLQLGIVLFRRSVLPCISILFTFVL